MRKPVRLRVLVVPSHVVSKIPTSLAVIRKDMSTEKMD